MSSKPRVSLAVVGPHGCGKTTALAQLCNLLGQLPEPRHKECMNLAKEMGRPDALHAWVLDRLDTERERGMTIEPTMQAFQSGEFHFTAVDTPGHSDYVRHVFSVMSLVDIAVLCVPIVTGEFEGSLGSGCIRDLALGCFTMGVKNVLVLVTKVDQLQDELEDDECKARFEEVQKSVAAILKEVGYKQKEAVPFVPVSGTTGDNLTSKSAQVEWYTGKPFLEMLDGMGAISRPGEKPLRLPVFRVHDVPGEGPVIVGRVETGSLRVGIKLLFAPGGYVAEVKSVWLAGEKIAEAKAGDIVSVSLANGVEASELRRGMVASLSTSDPAAEAETFMAQVIVLDHPGKIREGYCPSIAIHTAQIPCEFERLLAKIDRKTSKESEVNPAHAKSGEVISVKMRPRGHVCVEAFSAYPSLGRFAIRDHNRTVAVGVVKEVTKRPVRKVQPNGENQYFDNN